MVIFELKSHKLQDCRTFTKKWKKTQYQSKAPSLLKQQTKQQICQVA